MASDPVATQLAEMRAMLESAQRKIVALETHRDEDDDVDEAHGTYPIHEEVMELIPK